MGKSLSMKKLYILVAGFLMSRYKELGENTNAEKIIKKEELPYLLNFFDYIWKNKNKI